MGPMTTPIRSDLRNVAIVAHVDHGKTTLVDAMLRQTGTFRANQAVVDRVLDSGDLEREKGITILAKQTTVDYAGVRLNIVDTPGHADFGGEVERSLLMVDAVLLLVDAAEGPLPQTRYVLQKAMARHLPVIVALNKIDRSDARPAEVLDDVYELFIDLGADEHQIEFPVVYTNAKAGTATRDLAQPGTDLRPLLDLLVAVTPPPTYEEGHPLQLLVTNLSANDYVGRMAVGRIRNGSIRVGQRVTIVREEAEDPDGSVEPGRSMTLTGTVTALQTAHGIDRVDITEAGPGDIVSVAGLPGGDDRRHADRSGRPAAAAPPRRRRADAADDVRRQHLADGRARRKLRHVAPDQGTPRPRGARQRVDRGPPDRVGRHVRGARPRRAPAGGAHRADATRGLRADGVAPRGDPAHQDGETQEPYERITIDIPPDYIGEVQTALAGRKGRLEQMSTDADGRVRMEFIIPVRGLIGYRGQLLTDTRGTALLHQIGEGYGPWAGEVTHRTNGVLVADRAGESRAYALSSLVERSELFIGPSTEVYEGMVIGENRRPGDMDVNPTKSKALSKMRTQATDGDYRIPHAAARADARVGDRVHRRR